MGYNIFSNYLVNYLHNRFSSKCLDRDLKGDDAYLHAGWIQYILDNFPHINWYHQFYIGYPPFNFDVPTYYLLIALFNKITTLSVILLIQITMWLSMIALGLSAYILARVLKFQRYQLWVLACLCLQWILPGTIW